MGGAGLGLAQSLMSSIGKGARVTEEESPVVSTI